MITTSAFFKAILIFVGLKKVAKLLEHTMLYYDVAKAEVTQLTRNTRKTFTLQNIWKCKTCFMFCLSLFAYMGHVV